MPRQDSDPLEPYRAAVRAVLLLVIVLLPLPFGSVEPWAVVTFEVSAYAIGAAALLILLRDPLGLPKRAQRLLLPACVIPAVALIQLVPAPSGWTRLVASPTEQARRELGALLPELAVGVAPQTLDAAATLDGLMRYVAYACVALAAAIVIRRRRHQVQALTAVVGAGAFQAFYGAAEYLSGRQQIFGYAKQYFLDSASGTFINRNHYAGYLAMMLPLALALVLEGMHDVPRAAGWRERIVRLTERSGLLAVMGALAAGVIWAGVMLSYSRAGLLVAVAGLGFLAYGARIFRGRARVFAFVLVLPTLLLLGQGIRAPGERLADASGLLTAGGRASAWRATVNMIPDYLPFGSGMGTYAAVFDRYRAADVRMTWDHAHNDWLESLAEGGPFVTAALVLLLWFALQRPDEGSESRGVALGAGIAAAIGVIALHSLFDFCIRIPAIAALLALLIGMSCREWTEGTRCPR